MNFQTFSAVFTPNPIYRYMTTSLFDFFISLQKKYKNMARYAEARAKYQASIVSGVHESLMSEHLFETGIGYAILSRKLVTEEIAVGVFRMDVFCLGVRTAYAGILEPSAYEEKIRRSGAASRLTSIHPACCRKLVEQAVDFGARLGFAPHPAYEVAGKIFGTLDAGVCPRKFTFGKNGRPTFIPRPEDGPERRLKILESLQSTCGADGFDYIKE